MWEWKSHSVPIVIPAAHLVPQYGWVKHPTRPHWRNYKRAIPGGTTFASIMARKMTEAKLKYQADLMRQLFAEMSA